MKHLFNIVYGIRLANFEISESVRVWTYEIASDYIGRGTVDTDINHLFDMIVLADADVSYREYLDKSACDDRYSFYKSVARGVLDAVINLKGVASNG